MMPSSTLRIATRAFALVLALLCVALGASRAQQAAARPPMPAFLLAGGMGSPVFLRFSPDQHELAVLSTYGHGLFDTASWQRTRAFDIGIRMLAYSEDGKLIATAEGTDGARLWSAHDVAKPLRVLLTPAEASKSRRVFATAFSADGKRVLTADARGHVKVWDTGHGKLEADIAPASASVRSAAFEPNGKGLAFGDDAGVLYIWDLEHERLVRDIPTPLGAITSLSYSHDGTRLVTTHAAPSGEGVMIWDTRSWKAQIEAGYRAAAFGFDGKTLALGGSDVRLIKPEDGRVLRTIKLAELSQREALSDSGPNADRKLPIQVQALAWQRDGGVLAVGCIDGSVRLVATH